MARDKTYERNALDDMFDEFEETGIRGESLEIETPKVETKKVEAVEQTEEDKKEDTIIEETIQEETPATKSGTSKKASKTSSKKKKFSPIDFKSKEPTSATRTFRISVDLNDQITDMVIDGRGRKIPGSQGFLKTFANNALIKEMVEIGALDESYLDNLIPYDER